MKRIILSAALLAATCNSHALAATANVPFVGTVLSTCVLTIGLPGTIAPNASYSELSSTHAGGVAGTVAIVSTGATYSISADAPSSFNLAPANGNTNVSFSASYASTGATSVGNTLGSVPTGLNPGLTNLSVNLTATKSTGVFPQGIYEAEVVVRCE